MDKIKLTITDNEEGEVVLLNDDIELKIVKRGKTYHIDAYKQYNGNDEDHDYDADYIDTLTIED